MPQAIRIPQKVAELQDWDQTTFQPNSHVKWDAISGKFVGTAPSGVADLTFTFNQLAPSIVWTIIHNLGKNPSVTVTDSAGTIVVGDVVYTGPNSLTIQFSVAFSGSAYLN
jgi:hypothetical protein